MNGELGKVIFIVGASIIILILIVFYEIWEKQKKKGKGFLFKFEKCSRCQNLELCKNARKIRDKENPDYIMGIYQTTYDGKPKLFCTFFNKKED